MLGTLGRGEPGPYGIGRMPGGLKYISFSRQQGSNKKTLEFEVVGDHTTVTGWIQDTRMCTEAVLVRSCIRRHTPVRTGPGRYIHNQGLVSNNTCSTFNGVNLPTAQ